MDSTRARRRGPAWRENLNFACKEPCKSKRPSNEPLERPGFARRSAAALEGRGRDAP